MAPYIYQPLPEGGNHLRLLTLHNGGPGDPLEISIEFATFINKDGATPVYYALSYTWGSADNPITIRIRPIKRPRIGIKAVFSRLRLGTNASSSTDDPRTEGDQTLEIGQNLASALLHLRQPNENFVLWVDAICIQQSNDEEKSSEIQKMYSIYEKASHVIVWLGPGSEESNLGLKTLAHLGQQVEPDEITRFLKPAIDHDPGCGHFSSRDATLSYSDATWQGIANIFGREWFTRVWIWQEIVASQGHARIHCGNISVPWSYFAKAVICLRSKFNLSQNHGEQHSFIQQKLVSLYSLIITSLSENDILLSLLDKTRGSACSVQKDRLYAMVGISGPKNEFIIKPDYRKKDSEVFSDLCYHMYSNLHSLYFLNFIDGKPLDGCPSWVPNWANPRSNLSDLIGKSSAFGYSSPSRSSNHNFSCLPAFSIRCGVVTNVTEPAVSVLSLKGTRTVVRQWMLNLFNQSPEEPAIVDSAVKTLLGEKFKSVVPSDSDLLDYDTISCKFEELLNNDMESNTHDQNCQETFILLDAIRNRAAGRLFYWFNGHCGLAPPNTQPGDEPHAILGCPTLIMLRPSACGAFTVIGPCDMSDAIHMKVFLGPFGDGWNVEYDSQGTIGNDSYATYVNSTTGERTRIDPRKGEICECWKPLICEEDGALRWKHLATEKIAYEDPRLTDIEWLRNRGIDVQDITLI